jgi:hypothetical protein
MMTMMMMMMKTNKMTVKARAGAAATTQMKPNHFECWSSHASSSWRPEIARRQAATRSRHETMQQESAYLETHEQQDAANATLRCYHIRIEVEVDRLPVLSTGELHAHDCQLLLLFCSRRSAP